MAAQLPDHVFRRESAVLLRRLDGARGYLLPDPQGWQLYSAKNRYQRPLARPDAALVDGMRAQGLLTSGRHGGLEPAPDSGGPRRNDEEWPLGRLAKRR